MSAAGSIRRTSSALTRCETSSEETRASRTRRAISCEYWPPRSRTRTGFSSAAGSGTGRGTTLAPIVRRLLRDRHVVRVALAQPGRGDAHEACVLHRVDRRGAAVAHRLAQPADELVDHVLDRALVGDAPLDPLRDELLDVLD